ncbi:MAG: hypothetical protein KI790_20175 [Cyclobacteriaceae bacterium]|nr:hypothetical protein [Cyclobacteriaceae bacterium HetDA_MAG_MS6]
MELEISRVPSSDDENELGIQPYTDLNRFFNSMSGVRNDFGSDENLRSAVNCCILNGLDGHLIGEAVNVPLLVTEDYDPGNWARIVMGLAHLGHLTNHRTVRKNGDRFDSLQFELSDEFLERHPNLKATTLNRSRALDVHKWSAHPEVKNFVDAIYEEHFGGGNADIQKRHIKTLLLDLYVAWKNDPALKITVHKSPNDYKAKSRYNELHISRTTINVVDVLRSAGLILEATGFHDPGTKIGRTTRIWPSTTLLKMFEEARFGPFDITYHPERDCIILRNDAKKQIEYEDTDETNQMREKLTRYNDLLDRTFIDIPTLEVPFIEIGGRTASRAYINQSNKFTRRIFNRSSFQFGGRFYGGWWQRCPKTWREQIFLNDHAVSELDYSGLHIVLLYAREGIDYWSSNVPQQTSNFKDPFARILNIVDPYVIPTPDFITDTNDLRAICKNLMLVSINAVNDEAAFGAFRAEAEFRSAEKQFTNKQLGQVLDALRAKHEPIAHMMANDAGIALMNLDSQIAEHVIKHFTDQEIPILTVHDSFLVPFGREAELDTAMRAAFESVTGINNVRLKEVTDNPWHFESLEPDDGIDSAAWNASLEGRTNPTRSERYLYQLRKFKEWLASQGVPFNDLSQGEWHEET